MYANILLVISIAFAVSNNLLFHGFKNKGLRGMGDILFFNSLLSAVWVAIMLVLNHGIIISSSSVIWGVVYGSVTAGFLLCKMQALATGPISLTTFAGCSSLLISTAFGSIYFKETVSTVQLLGVVLLIFALFLTMASPKGEDRKAKKMWYMWCLLFFLCSGATGIIFKLHQSSSDAENVNGMMLAASITAAVLFFAVSLVVQRNEDGTLPRIKSPAPIFVIACGIVSCGYNRLNIVLSGMLPSIVFFPIFNGSVILFASLLSIVLFREKITKRNIAGILIGMLALIMTAGVIEI